MEENNVVIDVNPEATTSEPKYIQMNVDKGDRKYIFLIPDNSPIGETFDAAFAILERISELGKEANEKAKSMRPEGPSSECSSGSCAE